MSILRAKPLLGFLTTLVFSASTFLAQQHYPGNLVLNCDNTDETGPNPAFLYTCYQEVPSCQAFLMFRTTPRYGSLSSISNLTSSDQIELARINNISSSTAVLPPDTEVIIPVRCSCSGQYYQANAFYVSDAGDTYFTMANVTYQGLTTCGALMRANPYGVHDLSAGMKFQVPLRCACPTQEQIASGTRFMLTYLVTWNDTLPGISKSFNVSIENVAAANGLSSQNRVIFPFTTILIPLPTEPSVTRTRSSKPTTASYPRTPQKIRRRASHKEVYAGIGSGAALAVLCFSLFLWLSRYRRRTTIEAPEIRQGVLGIGGTLKVYKYEELQAATDNFSVQKRLSKCVYKGTHQGKALAVKKMSKDESKEIKILGCINHFNLISLYGACDQDRVSYLVYEYMEEGSLRNWLHNENSPCIGSWNHRILIALDIANGLDYLHNFTDPGYVHNDICSGNILLNGDMRAKLANFSLARDRTGNPVTRNVVGEKGYMAPEYILAKNVTCKTDVYAFGVVLLELITGRDAVARQEGKEVFLSDTVMSVMDRVQTADDISSLIDTRLHEKHPLGYVIQHTELAWRLLKLAMACLAREPGNRLNMAEVVLNLTKIKQDVYNSEFF